MFSTLLTLFFLIFTTSVLASDGVLEINQTCAEKTGCFTGDTAGFPVTIETAGSYLLTGNLTVPDTGAIIATVAGVQINMNGFEVAGNGTCSTDVDAFGRLESISCSGGTGNGIIGADLVRGGTVRGFATGIGTAFSLILRVDEMVVHENNTGINAVSAGLLLTDSIISTNRTGVSGQSKAGRYTIRSCVFERNGQGLYLPNGVISESIFHQNDEALRSNFGGRALVVNSSFTVNTESITGDRAVFRSNVFDNNGTNPSGTDLGNNICDGGSC